MSPGLGSQFPSNRTTRIGIIGTEVSRLDGRGQMMAKRWRGCCEFLNRVSDAFCHSRSRPFSVRCCLPVSSTEANGHSQLLGNSITFLLNALNSVSVIEALRLLQFRPQLCQPELVFGLGPPIQNWTGILKPHCSHLIVILLSAPLSQSKNRSCAPD